MSAIRRQAARNWEARWKAIADEAKARSGGERLLQAALAGATPLYGIGAWAHRAVYRTGLRKIRRVNAPVICVGNLTLGGTGKTPVVAWLVGRLREAGLRPVVVSRGYGGSAARLKSIQALAVSDGTSIQVTTDVAGDEPVELATTLPGTPVVIGRRRAAAARFAEERFHPDVLILDDGFQHYALHRDFNLVVLDASRPPSMLRRFPRGSLREGLRALGRADAVLLTRCDQAPVADVQSLLARLRRRFRHLALAPSYMKPECLSTPEGDVTLMPPVLEGKRAIVFCGVGNPGAVRAGVERLGMAVVELAVLPDHEAPSLWRIEGLRNRLAAGESDFLVCTAKDAVKLPPESRNHPEWPILVLRSRLVIEPANAETRLLRHLTRLVFRRKEV